MTRQSFPKFVLLSAVALVSFALTGCQTGGPNAQDQAQSVQQVSSLRSYFDKVNGDYSQLNETDKAAYVKAAGGEAKGQQYWKLMKEGPDAARGK